MNHFFLPLLLLFSSFLLPQSKVDSLLVELNEVKEDTARVKILHQLFYEYQYDFPGKGREALEHAIEIIKNTKAFRLKAISYNLYGDYLSTQSETDLAIEAYSKGHEQSENINFSSGLFEAAVGLGNVFWRKGNFTKAKEYHEKSFEIATKAQNQENIVHYYNNMANIYTETGEYSKAMELYTKASKHHLNSGNEKDYAITLGNIALVHRRLENYDKAIAYLIMGDSLFSKIGYLPGQAYVEYNLAVVYKNTGNIDDALKYNLKAIESYQNLGNKKRLGYAQYTMGSIHWKQKKFQKALDYYKRALNFSLEIKDSVNAGYSLVAIGDSYNELKDKKQAKAYLARALQVAKDVDLNLIEMDVYESLSAIYFTEKNYEEALRYKDMYSVIRDSFYTIEKRDLANDIEAKYQNEQKVKEIALLESEKELQTLALAKRENERNGIIALAILMLLLMTLLYNQFRIKEKSNKKLQELDRIKSNFFANISHEFRTPLTLIKGPIDQLEQNPDEQLSIDTIKMIRRNSSKVLKLVNQLLDLSKIDDGNLKLELTEGDVYKCLRSATSSFNSHAAQRNIDFRVRIPIKVLWASFDRDKLDKVIYNLLGNAFKFSNDGAQVSFEAHYHEQELRFQVVDSGKGISEEALPYIFDRFYQADNSSTKEQEGSGIGLSLSKNLIELMDGTVTVTSEEGKGSFFVVHLPIQEIKTRQEEDLDKTLKVAKPIEKINSLEIIKEDNRSLPTILLVEDNADMRFFISRQLVKLYKIDEAINGATGLKKAMANPPDLIITDVMMPKMDGIELCKKLKSNVHTSHIPVIMLTAKAGMTNKIEGLETGADDYLTKPFNAMELSVRVKNLIEQRKDLRELYGNKKIQLDPQMMTVTSVDQKFLQEVLSLLEDRYSNSDFSVPQMQEALAMSKTQLHRKLKALTNEAPGELLRNFRLKRAAQLLAQKADSVTQIAYQVGFNNPNLYQHFMPLDSSGNQNESSRNK